VLNFFRFILIKDKSSNLTGVWESDKILSLNQEFLLPLQKNVETLLDQHQRVGKEEQSSLMQKYGFPSLSEKEFESAHFNFLNSLLLLRDLVKRVQELANGA